MAIEHIIERMVVQMVLDDTAFTPKLSAVERKLIAHARSMELIVSQQLRDKLGRFTSGKVDRPSLFEEMFQQIAGDPKQLAGLAIQETMASMTKLENLALRAKTLREAVRQGLMTPETFARRVPSLRERALEQGILQTPKFPNLEAHQRALEKASQRIVDPNVLTKSATRIREDMDRAANIIATPKDLTKSANDIKARQQEELRNIRLLQQEYQRLGRSLVNIGRGAQVAGFTLSAVVTAPLVSFAKASVQELLRFEDGLHAVQAVANPTAEQLQGLSDRAMELSKNLRIRPEAALTAFEELLKAGVPLEDVMGDASEAVLKFAKVGRLDVANAAVTVADAMHIFDETATRSVDILSAAADASSISIAQMTTAFAQSTAVAKQAGLTLEDTAAAIAVLGNAGIKAGLAGTSLSTMLMRLLAPSKSARDTLRLYQIQLRDAQGNFIGFEAAIDALRAGLGELDRESRDRALFQLFGQRGIKGAAVFLEEGSAGIERMKNEMRSANTVTEKYNVLMQGTRGTIEEFNASSARLQKSFAESLAAIAGPQLESLASTLDSVKESWDSMTEQAKSATLTLLAATAAIGPLLLVFGSLANALGHIVQGWQLLGNSMELLAARALAARLGMVGLVAFISVELSHVIANAVLQLDKLNDELERHAKLTQQFISMRGEGAQAQLKEALAAPDVAERAELLLQGVTDAEAEVRRVEGIITPVRDRIKDIMDEVDKPARERTGVDRHGREIPFFAGVELKELRSHLKDAEQEMAAAKERVKGFQNALHDVMMEGQKAGAPVEGVPAIDVDKWKEAEQVVKRLRTPIEILNDELDDLRLLVGHGLDPDQFVRAADEAFRRFEANDPLSQMIKHLDEMEAKFKEAAMGADHFELAVERLKLAKMDLDDAERAEVMARIQNVEALQKAAEQMKEEERIMERLRGPREKYNETVKALNHLLEIGKLSQEEFNDEMKRAKKAFQDADLKDRKVDVRFEVHGLEAVEAGTAAFNELMLNAMRGGGENFGLFEPSGKAMQDKVDASQKFAADWIDLQSQMIEAQKQLEAEAAEAAEAQMQNMAEVHKKMLQEIREVQAAIVEETKKNPALAKEDFKNLHFFELQQEAAAATTIDDMQDALDNWIRNKQDNLNRVFEEKFKAQGQPDNPIWRLELENLKDLRLQQDIQNSDDRKQRDQKIQGDMLRALQDISRNTNPKQQPKPIVLQEANLG